VIAGPAHAASEEVYLKARDAAIAELTALSNRGVPERQITARHTRALAALDKQLKEVVGPTELKGFPARAPQGAGKINLIGLIEGDGEFGLLDGIVHASRDRKSFVVVTTEGLLQSWLRGHKNWWPGRENVPEDIAAALRTDAFYTQAVSSGAAVGQFAEIPLTKPEGTSVAHAVLALRAQDVGPFMPDEVFVSVVRDGRVFIAGAPAAVAVKRIPDCQMIWDTARKKSQQADQDMLAVEEQGYADYRRCYGERLPRTAEFAKLVTRANEIVAKLPAK
jgi:hypothetical protein